MTKYVICVPSYKRYEICRDQTLNMLKENKIDPKLINVYVANKEEYEKYKKSLNPKTYNKLIIGKLGLINQRRFIECSFPTNTNIVFMDDDIKKVDLSLSPMFKTHNLDYFIKKAFDICRDKKSHIWGVYPVFNPFFREARQEITTSLNYIVGAFYGIINRPNLRSLTLNITTKFNGQKEDVERTIKYFINDGVVVRFNKIGFVTKYYNTVGGLGKFNERLKPMEEASKLLLNKYPEFGRITKKKNGMTEFKLKPLKTVPNKK